MGGTDRLADYKAKRDFDTTGEPSGAASNLPVGHRFVVQRHRASHLHYDLRLEAAGVLLSWAVPKGPTLDPAVKRLAVHVEDHPLDYFDFEGIIPEDEYGGGDVIVWDWGTWESDDDTDPVGAVERGDLHFNLDGEKLAGRFVLVQRGRTERDWLLIKKDDDAAHGGWNPEDHPRSVKSGRTNDEVLAAPAQTWSSSASWAAPTADELAALDDLSGRARWQVGECAVPLSGLDDVVFPATGGQRPLTRRDLVRYLTTMAPTILPYLADRAIVLHRYPDGIGHDGIWHRSALRNAPDWIRRWRHDDATSGKAADAIVVESAAALAWLAGQGVVELHPWLSTVDDPQRPTWAMVDIDPGASTTFDDVLALARLHRTALDHLGLEARPRVTGRRGIQIWIPIARRHSFDETRAWVESLSRMVASTVPDLVSWEWEIDRRKGRARLDYTQNAINKTLVAPFSPRPAAGAPVSVPIEWDELDDPELRPDRWTIDTVGARLAEHGDPLAPLVGVAQSLPELT